MVQPPAYQVSVLLLFCLKQQLSQAPELMETWDKLTEVAQYPGWHLGWDLHVVWQGSPSDIGILYESQLLCFQSGFLLTRR